MAEYNPPEGPFALQGPSSATPSALLRNSAASIRRAYGGIAKISGIAGFGDLALSATGADKNISIATGGVWMKGTQATDQGVYFGYNAPTKVQDFLTAHPADPTNGRIDGIDCVVQDTFYGGATDTWAIVQTVGTPAGSPVAPAVPANGFRLGTVLVPAASTVIAIANITDLRTIAYFGAGGPWKFYRNLLAVAAASLVIPLPAAIPGLDDLVIRWYARGDTAAVSTALALRFNTDATANYDQQVGTARAAAALAGELLGPTSAQGGTMPANTATAGYFGQGVIFIRNYAGVIGNKLLTGQDSYATANTTGTQDADTYMAKWRTINTGLTRIDLFPAAGNLVAGTLVSASYE